MELLLPRRGMGAWPAWSWPVSTAMHYHVILTVDGQEDCSSTFDSWEDAEEMAAAISRQRDDWVPCRYPGRSWRAGEVAVYLDRRAGRRGIRQELAIIRCHVDGSEPWPACDVWRPRCGGAERSGSQYTRARVGRRGGCAVARTSAGYGSASRPASVAAKALHGAASSASLLRS